MNSIKVKLVIIGLIASAFACEGPGNRSASQNDLPYEKQIDSLLEIMTLEEKVGQMNQYNGFWDVTGPVPENGDAAQKYEQLRSGMVGSMLNVRGVEAVKEVQRIAVEETRLGIPLIIGFDLIHGYKTIAPIPLAESASWDMEAIEASARVGAIEAAASGINWTFAPMIDISRDARWGRVMEGAGEDPYLGAEIAKARIHGLQGDDLSDPLTIAACAKHFAGYGFSESGKDYNTVDVGTSTLYNSILPPFVAANEAGVRTVMNSFNELNGVPATGNAFLQRDILKGEWGFEGFVISDWGSIREMINHGYAESGRDAAAKAVLAGSDMDMESNLYVHELIGLVEDGIVQESVIDDATRRILRVKYELGLFEDPYRYCDTDREKQLINAPSHHQAALDMAKKSIVLLKNEDDMLPLAKDGMSIGVIGPLASDKNSPLGSWRLAADDDTAISVLEGLAEYPGNNYRYEKGVNLVEGETTFIKELNINETDDSGISEAVALARSVDQVVLVIGEHGYMTGEGRSRASIDIPGLQPELMKAVYEANPNVVLVLMNGRPLELNWADEHIPAIIEAWHLGSQSGHAIAQVLFGDYNPSGKLPMTFPRSVGQVPIYYNYKNTGRPIIPAPELVFWSHYTDQSNAPLYPFGYGLSYTNFEYGQVEVANTYEADGQITIKVELTNTGPRHGKEVVQVYLRDLVAEVTRPIRELKAFDLVDLQAGASKEVVFALDESDLGYYNNEGVWTVEPGNFEIYVGGDSSTQNKGLFTIN